MKVFMLNLPEELHAKLKFSAFKKGDTMTSFIIEALKENIAKEGE